MKTPWISARPSAAARKRRTRVPVARWMPRAAAGLLLSLAPALAAAQEPPDPERTPVPALLERYRTELETSSLHLRSETRGVLIAMLTGHEIDVPPGRLNSLLAGLEALVRSRASSEVRADAASLVAIAAEADLPDPRPALTSRVVRLYAEVDDELVRRTLLASMPRLADRDGALAFLREIAEQKDDSYPEESWDAVRRLVAAGPEGQRLIRAMQRERTARNPVIQGIVDELVASDFRPRRPRPRR